jgi:hypothetical protein
MKTVAAMGLLLALAVVGFAFDRVAVLEESYQET